MRRVAPILLATGMILMLIGSAALASTISIADSFPEQGFDGNTGNQKWGDAWNELPESEAEGVAEGAVQVVSSGCPGGSYCLAIMSEGLTLAETGASRRGDLSGLANASLSFKMNIDLPGVLNLTDAILWVKATTGSSWTTLRSYPLVLFNGTSQKAVPLASGFLHEGFGVAFVVTGLLDGDVLIDDVVISGSPASTTSTTSTTPTLLPTTTSLPITTTLPTITTTTLPGLLTTSTSTTTTTSGVSSTSTTTPGGGSTTTSTSGTTSSDGQTGSSGNGSTTTTPEGSIVTSGQDGSEPTGTPAPGDGLREAGIGIQAAFEGGRFGDMDGPSLEVMGIAIEPNYSMAVEVIESSWVYLLVLILLIATAIVSGLDRRRLKRAKHTDV